jgi:hypothetical protein
LQDQKQQQPTAEKAIDCDGQSNRPGEIRKCVYTARSAASET